jgi:hypothetical protein
MFISVPVLDRKVLNAFLECMFSVSFNLIYSCFIQYVALLAGHCTRLRRVWVVGRQFDRRWVDGRPTWSTIWLLTTVWVAGLPTWP